MRKTVTILLFMCCSCARSQQQMFFGLNNGKTVIVGNSTDSIIRHSDSTWAIGTSITWGAQATGPHLSYVDRLEDTIGCFIDNTTLAVPGQGTDMCFREINQYVPIGQTRPSIIDVGINDLNLSYTKTYLKQKMKYSVIGMIASMFLSSFTSANDFSVDGTGTRADITTDYGQRSQYISGKSAQTFNGNGYGAYTTISGTNVVISMISVDGSTYTSPQFRILIDGSVKDTFNIQGWSLNPDFTTSTGATQQVSFVYGGLSNTSHTVRIEILEGSKDLRVDYIGTMRAPASCRGVLLMSPPNCTSAYYSTSGGGRFSDAIIDEYGRIPIFEAGNVFSSLGYRISFYNPNLYYTPISPTTTNDGLHPNNTGHFQFYQGAIFYNTH